VQPESRTAKYDLTLALITDPDGVQLILEYNADLFDQETISRMLRYYQRTLEALVADADQRVKDVSILEDQEYHQVVIEWNRTERNFADRHDLARWFEEVVGMYPEAAAIETPGEQLSYRELNRRANRLPVT